MPQARFDFHNIPPMRDRTVVVTGANSGLGFETSRLLGAAGARIVMACRDETRANAARDAILDQHPQAQLEVARLDLADLTSVRRFSDQLLARDAAVDVLVNNAGVMAIPQRATQDGFEMQFGTNHLGHFALTGRLLGALLRSERPRVVTVSSIAHRAGRIRFDDLQAAKTYRRWEAYAQSKLANLLFAFELQRRASAAGCSLTSVACHPGYADTNLQQVAPRMDGSRVMQQVLSLGNRLLGQSAELGALSSVYAATVTPIPPDAVIGPDGLLNAWGYPTLVPVSRLARDRACAQRLWTASSALTQVEYAWPR